MKRNKKSPEDFLVEKKNSFNCMINSEFTLVELKILCVYLSRINARDNETRKVELPLNELKTFIDAGKINITKFKGIIKRLSKRQITIPIDKDYSQCITYYLFDICKMLKTDGKWFLHLAAHDDTIPLMFNIKKGYVRYQVKNVLRLKTTYQIRMYEILKQYKYLGKREIKVDDLRAMLGISDTKYSRWDNFRNYVLEDCKEALAKYTDIRFDYHREGVDIGGKWVTIIFTIYDNPTSQKDQTPVSDDDDDDFGDTKLFDDDDDGDVDDCYMPF